MYKTTHIKSSSLEDIRDLWEKNRLYHLKTSLYFKELYESITFEDTLAGLTRIREEDIRITVALTEEEEYVGYCISLIGPSGGELRSLHVDEAHRRKGIGRDLASAHLTWMKERKCPAIRVTVSHENQSTIEFYRSLGFYPNTLEMQTK